MATLYNSNYKIVKCIYITISDFNIFTNGKQITTAEKYYMFDNIQTRTQIQDFIINDLPSTRWIISIQIIR